MIDEARKTMKRCQVGVPRRHNAYEELHDILADCYGTIGRLVTEVGRLRASPSEAVERDAARWKAVAIVLDCITAVERHQMDESQFFGAVAETFEAANALSRSAVEGGRGGDGQQGEKHG